MPMLPTVLIATLPLNKQPEMFVAEESLELKIAAPPLATLCSKQLAATMRGPVTYKAPPKGMWAVSTTLLLRKTHLETLINERLLSAKMAPPVLAVFSRNRLWYVSRALLVYTEPPLDAAEHCSKLL